MRIAVVTETYPPEVNGVALTVHTLVSQMAADGHELLLVRPRQPGVSAMPLAQPIGELLVAGAALPKYPGLRFGFPAGRLLARHFGARRPDAIYVATEGPLGWSAVRAASRLGIPVATGFHTRFDAYAAAYGLGPLTPLVRNWLRRLHNASGATVVPTDELRQWLEERGFERVRVVARGVDTELFDPARRDTLLRARWGVGPRGLAVIYVGRIAAEKNLELAIKAFRLIRQQRPDARFIWVGTGPLAARLQREHPDFIFTGLRLGEDLAAHIASADLFLFPSLTETFGNVTIEAMAVGVPTIAFDYGAARAHMKDGVHGRLAASGDEPAFVDAAVQAAVDDNARRAMGVAARRAALALRPERVTREFVGLLAGLSAGAPA
jgi:glycosyltransferase involved in cell wall biosynthesis